jgi:hypothetical protein
MPLHQGIGLRGAVRDGVLPLQEIGFVAVVDSREISGSIDKRRAHADVHALVGRKKVCGENNGPAHRIAAGAELHREFAGFYALLLRIARRCRRRRLRRHSRRRRILRGRSRPVLVRRCSLYCWRRSIRVRRLLLCFRWRTKHAACKRDRASGQSYCSGHSSPGRSAFAGIYSWLQRARKPTSSAEGDCPLLCETKRATLRKGDLIGRIMAFSRFSAPLNESPASSP